ncbi:Sucrase/ferredoxin-like-domain-containing protein [Pyronema omphalodes]|nr:Sucrase/ferredoxin-like-domain-containing protein [Pyronema omphalodes]
MHPNLRLLAARIAIPTSTLFPRVQSVSCPPPSTPPCACNPEGLDIDRDTPLMGTMPRYGKHIVVATGQTDWPSKIEMDPKNELAGKIKAVMKKRGDPFNPTLVTNSSFPGGGIYEFPSGRFYPSDQLSSLLSTGELSPDAHTLKHPTVLICSHNTRDTRCGSYYPVLKREFETVLKREGLEDVRVEGTSHLSGHKFAGNVVVYLPQGWGVWYGRVGTEQVEGIVRETIMKGRVLKELTRGVVGRELDEEV